MSRNSPATRALAACALAVAAACSSPSGGEFAPRTYRMGFGQAGPELTVESILETIDSASRHSDAALLLVSPPWALLLADSSPASLIRRDQLPVVQLYRARGFELIAMIDVTDGLARDREHPELVAAGRSIAEPEIQALYREFALAVDSILHPEWLALAMEVNLIRAIAPDSVYQAVRAMANAVDPLLAAQGSSANRFITVQVEVAWGRLVPAGGFIGVAQDLADFPFMTSLGLSSYPYLGGFEDPEDIPIDYYHRLLPDGSLPLLITEGGWPSIDIGVMSSSPEEQARYIQRQARIADHAGLAALLQITYTDLNVDAWPLPPGSNLAPFANLGLVDTTFAAKPALAEWDRTFRRPLRR